MKHRVTHSLSPELARKATDKAWEAYQTKYAKYSPTAEWKSDSHADVAFTVKGVKLNGSLELEPNAIALDLDVPLLFRPFKKKAMGVVENEIQNWIKKAERGEI